MSRWSSTPTSMAATTGYMSPMGGAWLLGLPETEQRGYAELFDDLPLAIEVETAAGAVGIVHAECQAKSWQAFCAGVEAG